MIKDNKFKFQTNVSLDTYKCKTDAIACLSSKGSKAIGKEKMSFKVQSITVDDFLSLAISGHSFCNLFKYDNTKKYWIQDKSGRWYLQFPEYQTGVNKGAMKLCMKSDKYFAGAQAVFVDVDYTRYDNINDYISSLTYKPTAVYMSFSDKIEKQGKTSRRFRMVYVFDHVLDKDEFRHVSQTINDKIVFDTSEPMDDDCGTRMSQYMNGVFGNNEIYVSYLIYSVSDFPEKQYEELTPEPEDSNQKDIVFDEKMLKDMGEYNTEQFLHYYSWKYPYQYRTEKAEWIDDKYQLTDENYLQLWWYKDRVKDGQHRRRKLFKNACLRRLIFPDMTPNAALYNLYLDFVRFFDYSDGEITLSCLTRKVKNAFAKTKEQLIAYCDREIKYWRENRPQFILKSGTKCNWGVIAEIRKRINWKKISEAYDLTISLQQNIQNGIEVPQTTLYRYCKSNNINTNPNKKKTKIEKRNEKKLVKQLQIDQFKKWYNPEYSISENKHKMEVLGLELTKSTIKRWILKYLDKSNTIVSTIDNDCLQPSVNLEMSANDKSANESDDESYSFKHLCDWLPHTSWNSSSWNSASCWNNDPILNDTQDYDVDIAYDVKEKEKKEENFILEGFSWGLPDTWNIPNFNFNNSNTI